MTPDNFERSLRAFARKKPFRAFTVKLSSGDQIQVEHPEALMLHAGQAVYFAKDGEIWLFDHEEVAALVKGKTKSPAGQA